MTVHADIGSVRAVVPSDLPAIEALLAADPITHCFVASRVRRAGADPWLLGGDLLAYVVGGEPRSLLYCGANVVPVATDAPARAAFAERLRQTGRRSSSIVGTREEVLDLWERLQPRWGRAREVRAHQPLLAISEESAVPVDPDVRLAVADDLDVLVPACVAMFTAEVGVSPVLGGMASAYRARIAELVAQGRSFVRIENGTVVFKAEVGAVGDGTCQIQGVWVDPAHRGRGVSVAAMATVVALARASVAPTVSLYVNDFNTAARRCYSSVGFRQHGEFATVLF